MPTTFDMFGADRNGVAIPWAPTAAQNGTRTIKATVHRGASTTDYTATVNVAIPIPPLTGAEIRYSLTANLAGSLPVQGAVKTAPWYVFLNTSAGTTNPDVAKVEWFLDGVLQVTDNAAPFQMFTPWNTSDSASHTITARITRVTSSTPVTVTATLQTETSGPNPTVPLKWPRADNDYQFNITTGIETWYPTNGTSTDVTRRGKKTGTGDLKIVLPSDAAFDCLGGLQIRGYRSVELIGGQINVGQNWPQKYLDTTYPSKNYFARGDGQGEQRNGTLFNPGSNGDEFGKIYFSDSTRAVYIIDCENVWLEGLVIGGPWITEAFNIWPKYGKQGTLHLQNCEVRAPVMWRKGWTDSVNSFDKAPGGHNGGDLCQLGGPMKVYVDDLRVEETWYQGFFFKPGDSWAGTGIKTEIDLNHVVIKKHRGYQGGALVTWATSSKDSNSATVYQPFWSVTAKNEVYIGRDRSNDGVSPWPEGHLPPSAAEIAAGLPATATSTEKLAGVPEARYVKELGDDQYAHPTFDSTKGTEFTDVTQVVNSATATFGTPALGYDSTRNAHYAYYPGSRTATYNGVTYRADAHVDTADSSSPIYRDYQVWDYNEVQPDFSTWPAGIANDLGAFNGWGTAGIGYR